MHDYFYGAQASPSLSQAMRLKKLSQEGVLQMASENLGGFMRS